MTSFNTSGDSNQVNNCCSHVSVYYEQNPEEEEFISQQSPDDSCTSETQLPQNPPVEIHEESTVSIDLPPLAWHGYDSIPKILTVTNTGRTILINGQWTNSRPYIEGGPLSGNYLFSQIHFHCPSEHEIDGQRYPLEMHVVHYKTTYLTQERAMNERDGTVVLVYLFKLVDSSSTPISCITRLAPQLEKLNNRAETKDIILSQIIKPFSSNYYVYWGSVPTKKKSYLLQWIISANDLCVTKQEVEDLSNIITLAGLCGDWETTRMKPEDDTVFHVGEEDFSLPEVKIIPECTPCECHKVSYVACKCRWKCMKNLQCKDGQNVPVLECTCKPKSTVCRSHCKLHGCNCYQCGRCLYVCKGTCQSEVMLPSACCRKEPKCTKSTEIYCDLVEGPDGKPVLSCKSGSECGSRDCAVFQKKSNKKNKCCKKRKCVIECGTVITSDIDSTSKSSVEEKSKKSEEDIENKEASDTETKFCEEQNSECKPDEENSEGKVPVIRFVETEGEKKKEKIKKKKKKKKDPVIVNSLDTIHGSQTQTPLNAAEAIRFNLSTSGPLSSGPSDFDSEKSIRTKESAKCTSIQALKKTISENKSNTSSVLVQTDNDKTKQVPLETKSTSRSSKSRSKSSVNIKNRKDSEISEPEGISTLFTKSKTKLPGSETSQKKKVCINTDSELRDSTYSRTTASLRDRSQSKDEKNKKATDRPVSQSAQEVKCPPTKTTETLKCETKSPGDKSGSINKLDAKKSSKKINQKKQSEEEKGKTKSKSSGHENKEDCKSEITTLFEKKQNVKKETSVTGDGNEVQINFLLTPPPNDTISIPSDALRTSESDCVEEKGVSQIPVEKQNLSPQPYTVNSVTIRPGISPEQCNERSQVCLLMEHVFLSEHKENQVCSCTSQEYHVAIMYDQYTLQEYKGRFHPQDLEIGNYEALPLVPKYPDLENSNITLQDCIVTKENLDQICIRVKFLLSEKAGKWTLENKENKPEGPGKSPGTLIDEETQYSFHVEKSESKCTKEGLFWKKTRSQDKTEVDNSSSKSLEIQKLVSNSHWNRKKETTDPQKCKIIMKKHSNAISKEISESSSSRDSRMQKNEGEKQEKLKPLFVKRRKTVYFMYDKVERDESTGKKVFVGSFKTKEEAETLKKRKKIVPESESANLNENESSSGKYLLSLPNKEIDLEMLKLREPSKSKEFSPDTEAPSVSKEVLGNRKKDVVTLHKYKPKYSGMDRFKKECKNVLIGQVVNDLNKDKETFKDLAEIMGMEKEKSPKISIYELKEDKEEAEPGKSDYESDIGENNSGGLKVDTPKDQVSCSTFEVNTQEKPNVAEDSTTEVCQKSPSLKDSQALILIPVEVESLSKVEVILIEHLNEGKNNQKESGFSPLPSFH